VDETVSREILKGKLPRSIFLAGPFRIRSLSISAENVPLELYVPTGLDSTVGRNARGLLCSSQFAAPWKARKPAP
jgi:hypothetical protein